MVTSHLAAASRVLLAVFALAFPALAAAQSQATTAEINGRVVDAQGGALPGVTATALSSATGFTRATVSNEEGLYSLPLLPPGDYELTLELAGFRTVRRAVSLTVGSAATLNLAMAIGEFQETVVVEAVASTVETTGTVRTTTVTQEAIS